MSETVEVELIRPIKDTRLFNKNQRCWIVFTTGGYAAYVIGKHRGKGRYITAWLKAPKQCELSTIKKIEVSRDFAKRIGLPVPK